jgi:hypothetical protein
MGGMRERNGMNPAFAHRRGFGTPACEPCTKQRARTDSCEKRASFCVFFHHIENKRFLLFSSGAWEAEAICIDRFIDRIIFFRILFQEKRHRRVQSSFPGARN